MKKVLVSTLLAFCSVVVQAGDLTAGGFSPPVLVPTGGGTIVPAPTSTGVIDLSGINLYCLQYPTIPVVIHLNGEKVEIQIPNPLCPRR